MQPDDETVQGQAMACERQVGSSVEDRFDVALKVLDLKIAKLVDDRRLLREHIRQRGEDRRVYDIVERELRDPPPPF